VQLQRLEAINAQRAKLAGAYRQRLAELPIEPLQLPRYPQQHAWHLYIVRVDPERCGIDREAFMKGLQEQGIGTGIHFIATHLHTWYRERFPNVELPATEWNSARLCSIPLFPDMTLDDVERVACAIETTLGRRP
jgi:UDP-4-amino-4-deoxy-L-arabinose-oxoglutarate aminotransferase